MSIPPRQSRTPPLDVGKRLDQVCILRTVDGWDRAWMLVCTHDDHTRERHAKEIHPIIEQAGKRVVEFNGREWPVVMEALRSVKNEAESLRLRNLMLDLKLTFGGSLLSGPGRDMFDDLMAREKKPSRVRAAPAPKEQPSLPLEKPETGVAASSADTGAIPAPKGGGPLSFLERAKLRAKGCVA